MVRMNVAKSELTFATPTFAKIAVSAANTADMTAQNCQDNAPPSISCAFRRVTRRQCRKSTLVWKR